MSREEKVIHHIHGYEDLLRFLHAQHPDILNEWSNGAINATTADVGTEVIIDQEVINHEP